MANWLETKFEEFYLGLKKQYEDVSSGRESMPGDSTDIQHSRPWQELARLLESQKAEAERLSVASARYYEDALYAMVALADSKFINTPWYGAKAWRANCLEWYFFHTAEAGRAFFDKAERVISNPDPGAKEVCKIYYVCLALGFRGIYSDPMGQEDVRKLKRRLLAHFLPASGGSTKISPAAYEHTREDQSKDYLPAIALPLIGLLVAAILAYTLSSTLPAQFDKAIREGAAELRARTHHPVEAPEGN